VTEFLLSLAVILTWLIWRVVEWCFWPAVVGVAVVLFFNLKIVKGWTTKGRE
jgi:hypothetical protein